jgi:hypothetical protein
MWPAFALVEHRRTTRELAEMFGLEDTLLTSVEDGYIGGGSVHLMPVGWTPAQASSTTKAAEDGGWGPPADIDAEGDVWPWWLTAASSPTIRKVQ